MHIYLVTFYLLTSNMIQKKQNKKIGKESEWAFQEEERQLVVKHMKVAQFHY